MQRTATIDEIYGGNIPSKWYWQSPKMPMDGLIWWPSAGFVSFRESRRCFWLGLMTIFCWCRR